MKCTHCGAQIDDTAKFCYKCGSATGAAAAGDGYAAALRKAEALASGNKAPAQAAASESKAPAEAAAGSKASAETAAAPRRAESAKGFATYVPPAGKRIDSGGDAMRRDSFEGQGKASLWQRFKSLMSAMYESGRLQKILLIAALAIAAVLIAVFCFGGSSQGEKTPQGAGISGGYADYKQLISAYIGYMEDGSSAQALGCYAPKLTAYYAEEYRADDDILRVCDDAYQEGVYADLIEWEYGDTLGWDVDYYADEFEKIGLKADTGMDAQVYFTWPEGGETYNDYYVFEMVQADGRWYLISVYY